MFNIDVELSPIISFSKYGVLNPTLEDGTLLEFNISVPPRKEIPLSMFGVTNAYLMYRGEEFCLKLFELLKSYSLEDGRLEKTEILYNIIELVDISHVFMWLEANLEVDPKFKEKFDIQKERDGVLTKTQTYTRKDYLDLVAFIVVIQIIFGPIHDLIQGNIKENRVLMMEIIKQFDCLLEWDGYNKLMEYITEQIHKGITSGDAMKQKVLKLGLPEDHFDTYFCGIIIFEALVFMDLNAEPDESGKSVDVVSRMFGILINKINNTGPSSNEISAMVINSNMVNDEADEGYIESMNVSTRIPPGVLPEWEWAFDSIDFILKQITKYENLLKLVKREDMEFALDILKNTKASEIHQLHLRLISPIVQVIVDPRALDYIPLRSLKNAMAFAYAACKGAGYLGYANFILFRWQKPELSNNSKTIHNFGSTSKTKDYRIDEFNNMFKAVVAPPTRKDKLIQDKTINLVDTWVNHTVSAIKKELWLQPIEIEKVGLTEEFVYSSVIKNNIKDVLLKFSNTDIL